MSRIGPGAKIGKYTVESLIGGGAYGEVFLARYEGPGGFARRVAIKVLLPEALAHENALEGFYREGRTAALLGHRNIVQVIDIGHDGPSAFLVLEYIEGLDLQRLVRRTSLPSWLRLGVVLEVARGLAHAHSQRHEGCPEGVVHRDVKPSNILISTGGDVKLTDFGLAKRFREQSDLLTAAGIVKGTPGYMSPEQQAGQESGGAADVYSLGVVLFWIYTLALPSRQPGQGLFDGVPEGTIPPAVEPIIELALHPSPRGRPDAQTLVQHLGRELERLAPSGQVANLAEALGRAVTRATGAGVEVVVPVREPHHGTLTEDRAAGAFQPQLHQQETFQPVAPRRRSRRRAAWLVALILALIAAAAGAVVGLVLSERTPPTEVRWLADLGPPATATVELDQGVRAVTVDAAPPVDAPALDARPDRATSATPPRRGRRPPRVRWGFLSVDSRPWSRVYLDGRLLGTTPLWRRRVRAGARRLRLQSRAGRAERRVRITPGQHLNLGQIRPR